jgi:hypothetical protein
MNPRSQEHDWLQRLVGVWATQTEFESAPGDTPQDGTETVRSIDGLWVIAESEASSPAGVRTAVMTLGFDPAKGRIVGTNIGMGLPNLWVYDGTFAEGGRVLLLESEGPSLDEEGKTCRYLDRLELIEEDRRTTEYFHADEDGAWKRFMRTIMTRVS